MTADKTSLPPITTRQKITALIFLMVMIFLIWEGIGLFRGSSSSSTPVKANSMMSANMSNMMTPQPAALPKPVAMTPREMELMRLQQETEAKYLAALNELQMLKIEREIAESNKAIMSARLDTIKSEKSIVDLLLPAIPAPGTYAKNLVNPVTSSITQAAPAEVNYTVISVSQLQYKWNAVLGYQGALYNVSVGDILPADGSTVMVIDKSGVILEKNGVKKKISLVPVI